MVCGERRAGGTTHTRSCTSTAAHTHKHAFSSRRQHAAHWHRGGSSAPSIMHLREQRNNDSNFSSRNHARTSFFVRVSSF
jgi:hypothetical protein